MKRCCRKKGRTITLGICSVFLIAAGASILAIFYAIMETQIVVKEGNIYWPFFVEPSVEIYTGVYILNVTNPKEFENQKTGEYVAPIFEEIGPYVYREYWTKDELELLDTKPEEIEFRQKRAMYFSPEHSNGTEDDLATTISLVTVGLPTLLQYLYTQPAGENITDEQKRAIDVTINQFYRQNDLGLLFQHTVGDLLFGFEDPIYDQLVDAINTIANDTLVEPLNYFELGILTIANSSFGWPDYSVYTGTDDVSLTNVITSFNGNKELTCWFGDSCNQINGSDGTTVPPYMGKEEILYIFADEVVQSLPLIYDKDDVVERVPSWRYTVAKNFLDSPIKNPDTACFCPNETLEYCKHSGAKQLTSCLSGVPMFLTWPHMLYADDFYTSKVVGMNPIEKEHLTQVTYEPISGSCMSVDLRIQLNYFLTPYGNINLLNQINETLVFPIIWLNTSYVVPEQLANYIYIFLVVPSNVFPIIQIVFCVIGGLLAIWLVVELFQKDTHGHKLEKSSEAHTATNFSYESENDRHEQGEELPKYKFDSTRVRYISSSSMTALVQGQ